MFVSERREEESEKKQVKVADEEERREEERVMSVQVDETRFYTGCINSKKGK